MRGDHSLSLLFFMFLSLSLTPPLLLSAHIQHTKKRLCCWGKSGHCVEMAKTWSCLMIEMQEVDMREALESICREKRKSSLCISFQESSTNWHPSVSSLLRPIRSDFKGVRDFVWNEKIETCRSGLSGCTCFLMTVPVQANFIASVNDIQYLISLYPFGWKHFNCINSNNKVKQLHKHDTRYVSVAVSAGWMCRKLRIACFRCRFLLKNTIQSYYLDPILTETCNIVLLTVRHFRKPLICIVHWGRTLTVDVV